MALRVAVAFLISISASLFGPSAHSQGLAGDLLPSHRFVYWPDTDFPGGDLASLFDTSRDACVRSCRADTACRAFTFNERSNACFLKSDRDETGNYTGALSAQKLPTNPATMARATGRLSLLPTISAADMRAAKDFVDQIAFRHPAGRQNTSELTGRLASALSRSDTVNARTWAGFLASRTDSAEAWTAYSAMSLQLPKSASRRDRNQARREALPAALNAVFRAASDPQEAEALAQLGDALQANGRGRDSISVLRRATALSNRSDLLAKLDEAIAQFGFRVTEHQVDNTAANARICVTFSEPLVRSGVTYDSYVRVPETDTVSEISGAQLCVQGISHGENYTVTLRRGLPSISGEVLQKDVTLDLYVRDRPATVSFTGRGFVLPKLAGAAIPIQSVNAPEVDLKLRRVSDRNLLRALQDNYFGRPLSGYSEDAFANDVASEIWAGRADLRTQLNRETTTRLPLDDMIADASPGIYALTARVAGADKYDDAGATQWFVVSDLGLTSYKGTSGLHVWVRGLTDTQGREGTEVSLISEANAVLATVNTDANGLAHFGAGFVRGSGSDAPALLVARTADDLAFLPLKGPAFDLSDRGVSGRAAPTGQDAFLAIDRGAYRAGETIGATVIVRDASGAASIADLPLYAHLMRPDGAEYSRTAAQHSASGGYVFALPIGADVPRGTWRMDIRLGEKSEPLASTTLLVEDFLPERLDFTAELTEGPLTLLSRPSLTVAARYLFGAPAADLPLEAEVLLRPARNLSDWPGYLFGRHDSTMRPTLATQTPVRTDADGRAVLSLKLPSVSTVDVPLEAQITTRLSEGSGRPVERVLTTPLDLLTPMIGLKPNFEDVAAENSNAQFSVVALSQNGTTLSGAVTWSLNRVETRYQWYQLYGDWKWEPITRRTQVANGTLELGADPATLSVPVTWGEYELIATLDDIKSTSSLSFYAGWYASGDGSDSPDRLNVSLDKPTYQPGETATLRVSTRQGGTALVSVLASGVILEKTVSIDAGDTTLPLPVTDDWGNSAYVTVSLLRNATPDDPTPTRAMGLAHAAIEPGTQALDVRILAPEFTDGQENTTDVRVAVQGVPIGKQAHVTLSAVDLGILNLTAHDSPDPAKHFFGQRRLGVEIRDLYGRLIDGQSGALGQVRSGGDAAAQMRLQAAPPAEANMVFFSGMVEVGPDGIASIPVARPAFNGTIRLDAIAWTDTAVGSATAEIIARDPIVVTASLPRFLAPGDESRLLLELVHADGPAGDMPLSITAPGLELLDAPTSVLIKKGEKTTISVPFEAGPVRDTELTVSLVLPDGSQVDKTLALGIRRNDPQVAATRRFSLGAGETFRFDAEVFAGLIPGQGEAVLSAGPLARFDVPGLLARLERNPYGCTEQITSAALPLLYLSAFAPDTDVANRINTAIARVLTRQTSSGSFGLWRAESGAFWLDAYVTDFLLQARDAGYSVPALPLRLALNNLRNRINYAPDFDKGGEDIAYALLVLAREGAASMADLRYYADTKRAAFATPIAAAQLGAALALYADTLRADSMFSRAGELLQRREPDRLWRADFGSTTSDRAAVLRLAASSGSQAIDQTALAQTLQLNRNMSTQDAAQVLLAAHALQAFPGGSDLVVNGANARGPVVERLLNGAAQSHSEISNAGEQSIDLTLTTFGVPEVSQPAEGYGYSVTRQYFSADGARLEPPFQTGAQIIVVLTVNSFEDVTARLMVEDPLPAGLEIDNPNLLQSGQIRALDWLKPARPENAEFLSDRFRAALDMSGTEPVHLAYKLRAVTPGLYHHPAASVHDMYRPEYRAVTETGTLAVTE